MTTTHVITIYEDVVATVAAEVSAEALWLGPDDLRRSSGWELKPAGLCRGSVCVPLPAARRPELVRADGSVNLVAFAQHRGQPVVHDDGRSVWVFGRAPESRAAIAQTLEAPDFALPDLAGRTHRLSDHRGKKVLIASWASW